MIYSKNWFNHKTKTSAFYQKNEQCSIKTMLLKSKANTAHSNYLSKVVISLITTSSNLLFSN